MMSSATHVKRAVLRRERTHRARLAAAIVTLLVLAVAPLLVDHGLVSAPAMGGRQHLWAVCVEALRVLLTPFHGLFHLLLLAGVLYGAFDRLVAWRSARSALALLDGRQPLPGSAIHSAASRAGVDPRSVVVVSGLPDPAFTVGWLKPRIYVAAEAASLLEAGQLVAVLAHEHAHLRRADPLRFSTLRFLRCMFFWLPACRALIADIVDEAEVRADDAAGCEPLALAGALVTLGTWKPRAQRVTGAVGFNNRDLLQRRVRRLAGEDVAPATRVTRFSAMATALVVSLVILSSVATLHETVHRHCDHHGGAALSHLFCLGLSGARDDCPHSVSH